MGIPIGKLSLYAALGGIDPARTLPVLLDVGTDNAELLDDPMYLGWRHRRIGVCEQVVRSMVADGLSEQDARTRICVVDINGLLTTDRTDLDPAQRRLAQPPTAVRSREPGRPADLTDVIDAVHPTALIGLSTATGAFTEKVVRRIAAHAKRPIIMPLSNPTSRSEGRPQYLADWTEGRALVATGSPFAPMQVGDASIPVAQCNNIYIFPGVGLAVTAVRATRVTDAMMTTAAAAVGDAATIRRDPHGTLLPDRAQLADTATVVASAVAKAAVADAVAPALTDDQIDQAIRRARWRPRYKT
jgi:malate dehydrogenase (oxaloacetate-decarboxylating)